MLKQCAKWWYTYWHNCYWAKGKEILHINGRVGVFLCCGVLMQLLTPEQHRYLHLHPGESRKQKEQFAETIKRVNLAYKKGLWCEGIGSKLCEICPIQKENVNDTPSKV
jgi:hypothetical protein